MAEDIFVFPLSFAQQRLWFLDQLEPSTSSYNIFDTLTFTGPLDTTALASALNEIVRRHEVLRTCFETLSGQPVQIVSASLSLPLPIIDLSELESIEQEAEVSRHSTAEAQRPFNLSRCPLLRATLLRLSNEHHLLLLTMHHIISDGWSLGIFNTELQTLYAAYAAGQQSPLPELSVQYADFALWQREWLRGEVLEEQLSYWKRQLAGAPAVLELPVDRARPAVQTSKGASQTRALPRALSESLKSYSQREGVTLFMTLVSGFKALLYRYTGQSEIVIGTPIANRTRAELEGLIGFFVNTLVLRTRMEAEESFSGLVKRVREVALGAYAHQDVPFEKLVEAVQTERSLSHDALFQVMFQFINIQTLTEEEACDDTEEETCEPDEIEVERGTAKFDLGLDMWESGGRLIAGVEYREDLFDDATIARMLKHFEILLESAVANPDRRISELALLTESERDQLLKGWNSTKCTFPADKSVHQLFEAQVERTPDAVAVVSENEQLSYRELNARANKLARYLQRLGVGPEVLVGICVKRSVEMMVGLLGILKAGGAYVPLDPAYPKQRLKFMLDDAQAPVLLTQQLLLEALPEHKGKVICLDRDWESVARESDANVDSRVQPENLAYVIYTSGSTGKPKGVTIQHKSLVNWTTRAAIEYGLKPDDRVLQFSSISFDTAAEEIYPCLTLGGTLVLRSDSMSYSIPAFLQKCREFQISVLDLPTAYWHELTWELSLRGMELPASVRLVIVGGERALPERLSMWHQNVRESVRLMQGYGPTEATVVATIADLSKPVEPEDELREVSIGRPIGNAEIYILDEHLQPVPVGVSGELYIGGEGLARGYLHRPELTAEKFIPHPFSRQPGARLYRTGDVARYRLDGEIEFLGRRDEQVKMRGYRIELGEIEAVLREHPSVREAVVLVREDVPDDKRLVAYLVADDTGALSVSDLRSALSEHLPGYMIPSAFMLLDALPLTPNGKVNREALPEPMSLHDEVEMDYVAPRNEIERVIAGVWQEIFGMERLSVNSNFFDLGGHSLTLVRVHSKLRERLGKEISLIDMFKYPTISALANYFSQEQLSRELEELALHQRVFDRAEKQKEALNRRKQTMRQRVMTNG